jgi:hypothetical protein
VISDRATIYGTVCGIKELKKPRNWLTMLVTEASK